MADTACCHRHRSIDGYGWHLIGGGNSCLPTGAGPFDEIWIAFTITDEQHGAG